MPLNLLEDTRSQAELDKVVTTFLLKEKAKKADLEGWLLAEGWAGAQQGVLFLILHDICPKQ